jgi:hypothetical protein
MTTKAMGQSRAKSLIAAASQFSIGMSFLLDKKSDPIPGEFIPR